jgi:hypothetical protein
MVIDTLLALLADYICLLLWFAAICEPPHMLLIMQLYFRLSAAASISSTLLSFKEASLSPVNWDEVNLIYSLLSEGKIMMERWLWRVYLIIKEIHRYTRGKQEFL